MLAIFKREFKAYINSFIGLLFMAVSLLFIGLYFTIYQLLNGSPFFAATINAVIIIFLITVPVLCMKVFAEERHNKTDQLTLTAPVTVGQIVAGKYLALLAIFGVVVLIACIYPLILTAYGKILVGETYVALLGYFLYGAMAIAIGVLISSLTESQVIAAVLSFGALFAMFIMPSVCGMIAPDGNLLTTILSFFDMSSPFTLLLNGILDIRAIIYFVTCTLFALFLTTQVIQKRRYSVSVKHLSMGAYSTGMIAIVAAMTVVVNVFVHQLPTTWITVDLSEEKLYSISDTTKEFLDTLEQDVELFVMIHEEDANTTVAYTLERYEDYSEHIKVTYIDPSTNPTFAMQYTNESITKNSIIAVSDIRHKVIDYTNMWVWDTNENSSTSGSIIGYDGEGQITGAIGYVTSEEELKVYATTGHNELEVPAAVLTSLGKESIQVENLDLKKVEAIPDNTAALFIQAPELDFNEAETQMVIDYLNQGGTVILVAGTMETKRPYLESIFNYMGIDLVEGMVIEGNTDFYYQNPLYLFPNISAETVYTEGIADQYLVFAPYAQGMLHNEEAVNCSYTSLLNTSRKSFSKVDLYSSTIEKVEGDIDGPFDLGVEAMRYENGNFATLIAFSSSQMFLDNISSVANGGNHMLLVDTISACVNTEMNITVPEKSYLVDTILVPAFSVVVISILAVVVIPVSMLVTGFVIWFKRRRK